MDSKFHRSELLFGHEAMEFLKQQKVILFGVGGVGSWCAESLVRTGIHHLTLVDFDYVSETNINRQLPATSSTVGRLKTDVLRERLIDINPEANIIVRNTKYCEETADCFSLSEYDYIIDAIDSLDCKMLLIRRACETKALLYSSMGAALKLDPTRISVAEFWKVKGCPLAASLRRRFKKSGLFPKKKFKCVYSEELLKNKSLPFTTALVEYNAGRESSNMPTTQPSANGSLVHITAIFGFTIAGLVIKDIVEKSDKRDSNPRPSAWEANALPTELLSHEKNDG